MSIDRSKNNYYIIVDTNAIKQDLNQLKELSKYVDYITTKGRMNLTLLQKVLFYLYKHKMISTKLYLKFTKEAYQFEIKRIFGNVNADTVIQFTGYGYKKIILFSELNCNKVIYVHSDMYKEATIRKNISLDVLKYAYNKYDKLAVVTEDLIEPTKKIINMPEKFYITRNIIDYNRIIKLSKLDVAFDDKTVCNVDINKLNEILNSKNKKFITIGRFSKEKGHERLINSFERLWKKDNSVYLIIIGGHGVEYNNILNQAENSICKNNIIIIKYVSNPYAILKKCDYFILPSFYEGFGIVIAEADILGKPVVTTNIVGPSKFMQQHGGTLVENSEEGVYKGLELLYENKVKPMNVNFEEYNEQAVEEFEKLLN